MDLVTDWSDNVKAKTAEEIIEHLTTVRPGRRTVKMKKRLEVDFDIALDMKVQFHADRMVKGIKTLLHPGSTTAEVNLLQAGLKSELVCCKYTYRRYALT